MEVGIGEAGPGPSSTHQCHADSRILDEQDDKLITDWNERAGQVIHMDERLHVRWQKLFLHDNGKDTSPTSTSNPPPDKNVELNPYAPLASELDWQIAKWVVQDNKSFDHFLTIPGVCPLSGIVESLLTL